MDAIFTLNQDLFLKIFSLSSQNQLLSEVMILAADYLIFVVLGMVILSLFKKDPRNRKAFLLNLLSLAVGFVILKIVTIFIFEPRPFLTHPIIPLISIDDADSFPSDHSLVLSITTISYLFYRIRFAWLMAVSLLWTGFARIFVGVHYPIDIIGGVILGVMAVTISWWIKNYFLSVSKTRY